MKLLTYRDSQGLRLAVKDDGAVFPLSVDAGGFFEQGLAGLPDVRRAAEQARSEGATLEESSLRLGPAVPAPGKIICIGLNYRKHAEEANLPIPETPILFSKFNNALAAAGEPIRVHPEVSQLDYEAELGIVIGRRAERVGEDDALDYVLGYCCANDLSDRALQFRTSQWLLGKSLDGFCPLGPYLVTADEVPDPDNLSIACRVNGETRQDSRTADMIFSCRSLIAYITRHFPLNPGDVILTGTPEGVIMGYPEGERRWLRPGDEVTIEIEGLGSLTNRLV